MNVHVTIKEQNEIISNLIFETTNKDDFMMKLGHPLYNEIEELKAPTVITITVTD